MKELKCPTSKFDPALYFNIDEETEELKGMLMTHVDDIMYGTGDDDFEEKVMKPFINL